MGDLATAVRVPAGPRRFAYDSGEPAVVEVGSGTSLVFETLDCFSNLLSSPEQRFRTEAELIELVGAFNPVSGPVAVSGAVPGDALAITVGQISLGARAVTVLHADPELDLPFGDTRVCAVEGDTVWFPTSLGRLALPARPMVGTLGVASAGPAFPSLLSHARCGGNMDCQALRPGSVLVLPVEVPGGLVSLGDVHALMGDAEITGTALEAGAEVTVRVDLLPGTGRAMAGPYLDEPHRIGTVGCAHGVSVDQNLRSAMTELRRRLVEECGYRPGEAYELLGAVAEVTVNQCVHGGWSSVHAAVPRYVLPSHLSHPSP
ncbi:MULTISPECIES: acetamidase/formamidase family protein [Nonomuraea]|uniref:Acetamidase/formamidase family protein n=1 Tax=Nonomuraea mangrovi TaxID=2316207 RepID=A0ABW4T3W4_9ACTN